MRVNPISVSYQKYPVKTKKIKNDTAGIEQPVTQPSFKGGKSYTNTKIFGGIGVLGATLCVIATGGAALLAAGAGAAVMTAIGRSLDNDDENNKKDKDDDE